MRTCAWRSVAATFALSTPGTLRSAASRSAHASAHSDSKPSPLLLPASARNSTRSTPAVGAPGVRGVVKSSMTVLGKPIALASSVPATSSKGDGPVSVPVIPVTYFAQ